ncbi:hypothetical protein M433DRAFT_70348 [Acidomyces richmondensis BFW]|nr:MAG: hypothetical protein FE78DRAFT_152508 [Acidomyces sp. 'richmondensis']KYG44031.1 hypothetical protein M433DRAFT_70348 [Acidomyces richmondensis BFW]
MDSKILTASYASHSASETFSKSLPALSDLSNVSEKTVYLSALRLSISQMQSDVNEFLTKKMDEDQTASVHQDNKEIAGDEKEEEMYGEEDPEQDG